MTRSSTDEADDSALDDIDEPEGGAVEKSKKGRSRGFKVALLLLAGFAAGAGLSIAILSPNLGSDYIPPQLGFTHQQPASNSAQGGTYDQSIEQANVDAAFRQTLANPAADKAQVTYADLNGDGVEDALVGIYSNGDGKYLNLAVYTMNGGQLRRLWVCPDTLSDGAGYIGPGQTVVYTGTSSATSGSLNVQNVYKWNGSTFQKQ